MAKVAKTVAIVAGVVAFAAGVVLTGGALLGVAPTIFGVAVGTIATIAGTVAAVASLAAQSTAKKPPAQGSATQTMIGANMATPCLIGRTYSGGNRIHEAGYGGTVAKVKNPYRSMVDAYSIGPIDSIESQQADFTTIGAYYSGWLSSASQLGLQPEASALAGPYGAIPDWGSSYKLSGLAAILWSLKFDKDGQKFSAGVPQLGGVFKGVKAYDPRLDSTYPGGSGAHRFDDEDTWEWSDNPALHAIAYARGRYQNDKKIFGCGFGETAIDLPAFVELANLCEANDWTVGGVIYEPGSKWDNLKRLLGAAAAEPCFVGAKLSVRFSAPKVALDTITADDLADGEYVVPAMKTWRDRRNGIIPRYRSEDHKWEYVQSDLVSVPEYVTEDRDEEKQEELQYDLVQDKDQAAQLAAYELVNRREFGPIVLPCKPRMIEYVPGEALEVDIPELGLNGQLCIITGRRIDPATAMVELTLESETTAKHAFALGLTGTAPPTPSITTGEELDEIVNANAEPSVVTSTLISTSTQVDLTLTATDTTITISDHIRRYGDKDVDVDGDTLTGLTAETVYWLYYDDAARAGGAVTYVATEDYFEAFSSATNPDRHYAGYITTDAAGGTGSSGGGSLPPGGGGRNPYEAIP